MKINFPSFFVLFVFAAAFFVSPITAAAQSNETLDIIYGEEQLSAGSAAYLLLTALEKLEDEATPSQAFAALSALAGDYELTRVLEDMEADTLLTLGQYSFLVQNLFGLPKGMMSIFLPGPRYSARDLGFLRIIQGRVYPDMPISGERAGRILVRVLTEKERRI